jgi:predicted ribosome quality control (RQC) complex YloA/Tae2 family protein
LPGAVPAPTDAGPAAQKLHQALAELLAELGAQPTGFLYRRSGTLVDVEPFSSRRWAATTGIEVESIPSFSRAAHQFFSSVAVAPVSAPVTPAETLRGELSRQRDQQVQALETLAAEVDRLNRQAEAIYAHYDDADRLRTEAEHTESGESIEVSLGGIPVPILLRRPLEVSARSLYEEAKRAQSKLAGARTALGETDRRIAAPVESASAGRPAVGGPVPPLHKPLWFERYRWFISTEGVLVIGGRDAATNDLIVRKYLKTADLYVHADIHGAPSVIIKHSEPGSPAPTETTFTEAAQFSLAFSKAWRAGLASGSAFWVSPDQVSKAGASGEFVARGAFVIHGTKNILRDLPVELAIGTLPIDGVDRWCVAPPSALRARGQVRFLLTPGEERDRPAREVELSEALGVGRSRLQSLLPAGGLTVRPT